MTTVSTLSASKALKDRLNSRYAKSANATSGFITTVTNDSTGRAKSATVQLSGGTTISVQVPYGSNIYPGISVSLVNDGSPSLASWRIASSSSASPVTVGGQIVNQNGSIIANFDSIWVKDRGYIMAGGMEDILGDPTGPRVMMNEYGLFGYAIPFPEPVVSIATIESDDLHVGDVLIGYKRPSHANLLISPEQGLIEFDVNDTPFLVINGATGNRLEDYLWIGPSSGPQVGMGKMLGVAEFAMRDLDNRYVFLVRSDPMRVQVGATDDAEGWVWDSGRLSVRGSVEITGGLVSGSISIQDGGALVWANGSGIADASGMRIAASPAIDPAIEHRYNIVSENGSEALSFMGGYYTAGNTTSDLNILWLEADSSTTNRKAAATLRGRASTGKASANIGAFRGAAYASVDVSVDTSGLALTFIDSDDINLHCDKFGTYGVAPVARQLLATGAGRTVDDVITFLQNLGLARQS